MKRTLLALITLVALAFTMALAQDQASMPQGNAKAPKSSASKAKASKTEAAEAKGAKLDINSATKEDLEKLPGIGPATSQKIIDGRPYKAKSDLVKKKIVSQSEYDKIKDQIIAHQAASAKSETPPKKK